MLTKIRKAACGLCLVTLLGAGCGSRPRERAAPRPPRGEPTPAEGSALYGAEEALRDALSGPWTHVGTGPWPGNGRMHACAYRNERVIVVNVYCGVQDTQAFRLEVYSPTRGRVRIYAESKRPVSAHARADYFSFSAESEPPAGPSAGLGPLDLSMSFAALRSYDEQRQAAYLPACYGGMEQHVARSGCLGPLAAQASAWSQQHAAFLEHASPDWYRAVSALRQLAARHGRDPH